MPFVDFAKGNLTLNSITAITDRNQQIVESINESGDSSQKIVDISENFFKMGEVQQGDKLIFYSERRPGNHHHLNPSPGLPAVRRRIFFKRRPAP